MFSTILDSIIFYSGSSLVFLLDNPVLLCAMEILQDQPLHVLSQITDGLDVAIGQHIHWMLAWVVAGLVDQSDSFPLSLPPR